MIYAGFLMTFLSLMEPFSWVCPFLECIRMCHFKKYKKFIEWFSIMKGYLSGYWTVARVIIFQFRAVRNCDFLWPALKRFCVHKIYVLHCALFWVQLSPIPDFAIYICAEIFVYPSFMRSASLFFDIRMAYELFWAKRSCVVFSAFSSSFRLSQEKIIVCEIWNL